MDMRSENYTHPPDFFINIKRKIWPLKFTINMDLNEVLCAGYKHSENENKWVKITIERVYKSQNTDSI